ncbi:MAG TPA: acyltransferase [Puia sp.]|jgi:acetyltransferase-like isoleucine patch superfamily enzyme|nr:acyltransferase [Puia sp.]HEV3411063.1 acyltransferase [Puia sp.]
MLKSVKYFLNNPLQFPIVLITRTVPFFRFIYETADYQNRPNFEFWFKQKVLNWGGNKRAYWPVHWTSKVYNPERIIVGIDAYPGIMGGCYITGRAGLAIGDYTQIGPNVVIVTANHDPYDLRVSVGGPVKIGKCCWIGAGAKIMPDVILGDWTTVAAGSVVTKPFPEGHCVIAGVPARKIKDLEKEKCISYKATHEYYGYIPAHKFERYRKRKLDV